MPVPDNRREVAIQLLQKLIVQIAYAGQQHFFQLVTTALTILSSTHGAYSVQQCLNSLPLPLMDDYSHTVNFDGLPLETALLIRCAIAAEISLRPCLQANQLYAQAVYGEWDAGVATDIFTAIVRVGRRRGGCIFDMVKNFNMLRCDLREGCLAFVHS